MPTMTVLREGTVATVDSFTKLVGTGQGDTAQDQIVPTWAKSIKHVAVCAGVDGAVGQGNILVKFTGATQYGDQILALAAFGNIGTTVATASAVTQLDVDIPVVPGKPLECYGAYAGDDTGTPELAVCWTFSDQAANHSYITRQGDPGTADTYATLSTENGTTTVNDQTVMGKAIDQVIIAKSMGATTQEPYTTLVRLQGVGGSIFGNEHMFACQSTLTSDGTLADGFIVGPMVYQVDIPVTSGTVRVQAVDSGATVTDDSMVAVTLAYRM